MRICAYLWEALLCQKVLCVLRILWEALLCQKVLCVLRILWEALLCQKVLCVLRILWERSPVCSVGALLALASGKAERRQVHPLNLLYDLLASYDVDTLAKC